MIDGYRVTAEDWLWLLRAVESEGEPRSSVARALVNLWARQRARAASKRSIAALVRAYAQPVNPIWAHGGERDVDPVRVSASERRRAAASRLVSFSPRTARAVYEALTSGFSGSVTDYAAPWVDATKKGMVRLSEPRTGENTLWTRDGSWGGYEVKDMTTSEKVAAIRAMMMSLPRSERVQVDAALRRVTNVAGAGGLLDGVKVIRPGEPGFDEALADEAARGQTEWDLTTANTVDAIYQAVAERVKELAGSAGSALSGGTWFLLALALVLLVSRR